MRDDELILYLYDELTAADRREVESRLRSDPDLASRLEVLRREFADWKSAAPTSAPADMVQRWHDSIDSAAAREHAATGRPRGTFSFASFAWGAAVTAALALGIGIGAWFSGRPTLLPTAAVPVAATQTARPLQQDGAFARGLQVHFRDAQRDLSSIPVEAAADRTELVMQLIRQNRLFERAAEENGSDNLARVLRAFEPILLRLASEDIAPEDAEDLRKQLAFELRVMLTILERDASNKTQST
jgi:hypothetical protein